MNTYAVKVNGEETKEFRVPTGRHEVTYEQWKEAYTYFVMAEDARRDMEDGDVEGATKSAIESICRTIEALSDGITYDELMQVNWSKLENLFLIAFGWIQEEEPKTKFKINGKKFSIPDFMRGTAGDFMDVMSLLSSMKDIDESNKGIVVAAVYMREGEYYQDLQEIEQRIEFLKKYGRMDLFYSISFFLLSSLRSFSLDTPQHSPLVEELESLISLSRI
tara:strand:+ start:1110 stop:1769 length:660 start_codon:yes stop_codon:yes gene_type:complete